MTMIDVGTRLAQSSVESQLPSLLQSIAAFLIPQQWAHATTLAQFALSSLENIAHSLAWFLILGLLIYGLSLRRSGRRGADLFSYAHAIDEPGEKFSLAGALRYLLPGSFYSHRSFRFDMLWLPFSLVLGFLGLLGVTLGPGVVQGWLLHRFGPSPFTLLPEGGFATALQVILVLLARDFGRFLWHYQGHVVPFFWEFHKGHHSAEVLHPFGVRTHPVDMFIRNTYTGVGSGLIAGTLIYLLGMSYSPAAVGYVVLALAVFLVGEIFEHTHVRVSLGKPLNRIFYAPYMHHFHHGAGPQHANVNLGITGGLTLWDFLFGTLYWPKPGETVVWGASLAELGENNPHRTLKGFFWGPFVAAFRTLRAAQPSDPVPGAASASNTAA
jgi:sterol desaturase/sphingolipid hydroxylase (fatty acid hydroxylase superfamily)